MIAEIAECIMDKYRGDVDLRQTLTGGLHFQQAEQENTSPYCTFYIIGIDREEIMGDADDCITEFTLQFNVFSAAIDGGYEIANMSDRVAKCFSWETFYPSGYRSLWMRPDGVVGPTYVDEIWQCALNYSLGIQKN